MKVKLTVIKSNCRCDYLKEGDTFVVEDLCPPICHELWNDIYPYVYALQHGATLECGKEFKKEFVVSCQDEQRVVIHGEVYEGKYNPNCPCVKAGCPRHGLCDECHEYHKDADKPRPCER